jgi:outer membrane receptor for ferrienterochelin and colicin
VPMSIVRKSVPLFWLCCLLFLQAAIAQDPGQKCPPGTSCSRDEEQCPPGSDCSNQKKPKLTITPETIIVESGFQDGAVVLEPTKTVIDMSKFDSSGSIDRVEDVLKHMTGIDVIQQTGGADPQQEVIMRGFDDSRFTVAINGRPITGPTAGADTFVDWSSLTTGDIEQIEIIRGSASARYENAAGGVINIITKRGRKQTSPVPKVSAESSYSSFNAWNNRGTMSGGVGSLGYFINFGARQSDGFLRNNYWDGTDYSARMDYSMPWKGLLSASYKRSVMEHGYPVVNDPNSKFSNYDPDYPIMPDDADTFRMGRLISYDGGKSYKIKKKTLIDVSYDQPLGHTNLSVKYFKDWGSEDSYSYQRNSATGTKLIQTYQGSAMGVAFPDDRKEKTWGTMIDYQLNMWSKHALAIGYSHRRMEVKNKPDLYRIQGVYIEDQYAVTKKLILNLGLRYMAVREHSYEYKAPGESTSHRHKIFTKLLLPKFTATYRFNPQTEIFASVNRDYHFPGC